VFDRGPKLARAGDHFGRGIGQPLSKLIDRRQLTTPVERPLGGSQDDTAAECFEALGAAAHRTADALLDRLSQPPARGMVEMLVVAEFSMVREID